MWVRPHSYSLTEFYLTNPQTVMTSSLSISRKAWGLNGNVEVALAGEALNRFKMPEKAVTAMTRLLFFKKDLLVVSVFILFLLVWLSFRQPAGLPVLLERGLPIVLEYSSIIVSHFA